MRAVFRITLGVLVSLLFLNSCKNDYTLDVYGTISGQVTDFATGNPLASAQVTLVPGSNTVQTTADGVFFFSGLDEGQYTVSVQKEGYQSNRKNVNVLSGESTSVVITLTEIPKN